VAFPSGGPILAGSVGGRGFSLVFLLGVSSVAMFLLVWLCF
jgi:hypothetical protein